MFESLGIKVGGGKRAERAEVKVDKRKKRKIKPRNTFILFRFIAVYRLIEGIDALENLLYLNDQAFIA